MASRDTQLMAHLMRKDVSAEGWSQRGLADATGAHAQSTATAEAVALPPEYAAAPLKRLRFTAFTHIGQVVRHGRKLLMRIGPRPLEAFIRPGRRPSAEGLEACWDIG